MAAHRVHALLMGGQACVLYGAAEFSRGTDLAVLADPDNWRRLNLALADLHAEPIAVPPGKFEYLVKGHALHFRCHHPQAEGMRVDIMSRMRGVAEFPHLWERRTSIADDDQVVYDVLGIADLVQAKKTQRKRDWPMIQRLVESDYIINRSAAGETQWRFWLEELRTPELLVEATKARPDLTSELVTKRTLLNIAITGEMAVLSAALDDEEMREREIDRLYWLPLKTELERLRHQK